MLRLKFFDYKCNDCGNIFEVVIENNNKTQIKCNKCGSENTSRVFAPVGFTGTTGNNSSSSLDSSKSCSGTCTSCSGCS